MWDVAFMLNHPEIQDNVRAEIDTAAGDGMVGMEHRSSIPLTEATINEVWRCGCVVGVGPPRNMQVKTKEKTI